MQPVRASAAGGAEALGTEADLTDTARMNDDYRRLVGLTDVRSEAVLGGNVSELLRNIVEHLNSQERVLNLKASQLAGTEGWASHGAAVTYGQKAMASLALICNETKTFITMDRIRIDLIPYKPGVNEPVLDLRVECSRLVRDIAYQQKADREMSRTFHGGDLVQSDINPSNLLDLTRPFWKSVADLRPKPMRGGQGLSVESFDILRILDRGPMTGDFQPEWVELETGGLIKQATAGAVAGRRVYVITAAGRAALEDA